MKSGILAAAGKVAIEGKAIVGEMSSDSLINHGEQSQEQIWFNQNKGMPGCLLYICG